MSIKMLFFVNNCVLLCVLLEAPFFSAAVNETGSQKPAKSDATDVNTDEGDRRLPDAERRCDRSGSDCDTGGVGIGNQSEEDKEEIDDGDGDGQEEEGKERKARLYCIDVEDGNRSLLTN